MNAALEVSGTKLDDFLDWVEILRAQNFHTEDLETEQQFLAYLVLRGVWHLLNNAYQGDGRGFLTVEQTRGLQEVDAQIAELERQLPPGAVTEVRSCIARLLRLVDEHEHSA
ncbi:MAG: hypothetical protein ACP5D5_07890 [Acidithiobacillus sp.]|uniref:hypothetical protein n=1 Tax=Acidithiobacillus sp. TaxID=1872118 RepID=UPI003D009C25